MMLFFTGMAQDELAYTEIVKAENQLQSLFNELYNYDFEGHKHGVARQIDSLFIHALSIPGSFNHKWKKLDKIGRLESDDGVLKVFSWLYKVSNNDYRYYAYMQFADRNESKLYVLKPGNAENIKEESYPQAFDDWHGKVYYEIITTREKRRTYYTLLGLDMNNAKSSIKTVEIIALHRGEPQFVDQKILDEGKVKDRLVFEYSSDVNASLRFNEMLDMIVFDHLTPLHPLYTGNYEFYGPDGSYDGLRFTEGIWVREADVDARNPK
ncbi:MAG TPA: hypothetical protein VJ951_05235 [Bacteroidales bacterium]|nr:hypothetical protein [Bacteroidales bacterium]